MVKKYVLIDGVYHRILNKYGETSTDLGTVWLDILFGEYDPCLKCEREECKDRDNCEDYKKYNKFLDEFEYMEEDPDEDQ